MTINSKNNSHSENNSYSENIYLFKQETKPSGSADTIEFFRSIASSKNIADFNNRVAVVIRQLGFTDFSFSRISSTRVVKTLLTSMNQTLHKKYLEQGLHKYDMVLDYVAAGSMTPIFHSTIREAISKAPFVTCTLLRNQEILNLIRRFGYEDFYLIPMKDSNGRGAALFTVASKGVKSANFQQRIESYKTILQLLADAIDYVGRARFPKVFSNRKQQRQETVITPMPLRLLILLAKDDLNLKQAAERLNISLDTANKHMAAAKSALGVKTQAAAVYQALQKGLI
ncbi:MAG: autoinducer binding domain-containing protein [Exilibacterium sp.]